MGLNELKPQNLEAQIGKLAVTRSQNGVIALVLSSFHAIG
jgi:hypothetical protein